MPYQNQQRGVVYACYSKLTRSTEDFIENNMVGLILSGSITVINGNDIRTYHRGQLLLYKKNRLAKFIKLPENEKPFESICVILDKDLLTEFAHQHEAGNMPADRNPEVLVELESDNITVQLFRSLIDIESLNAKDISAIKQKLVSHLITEQPHLKDILFDFSKPWKVDLEPFMNRNFRFNLQAEKLAYMSGRSLSTFKRDFKKIFSSSPERWVQSKRLEEAYYLICGQGMKPAEIYQNIGFESLSHFSYAFKRFFGIPPSRIAANYEHKKSTFSSTF
jgi:AraC family transcriptional regulator, exoenzyme S synthesis regulatory protein ExsA